jgi:acyl-CoA synthetase (NDP forming)
VDIYSEAMKAVLADPAVDAVLLHVFVGNFRIRINLPDLAQQSRAAGKPVFIWLLGRRDEAYSFQMAAREQGVPVFQELHRAVECLSIAIRRKKRAAPAIFVDKAGKCLPLAPEFRQLLAEVNGPLDEFISKQILKTYDIPTVDEAIATDVHECLRAAARIGYPVVMKGLQEGDVHKTELGLVYLDIRNKSTAMRTFKTLTRKMGGRGRVLIQKHVKGHVELILGLIRDPQFGPCVMIGLGGIMTEVFQNAVFAMAPLNHQEALALTGRLQGQKLLDGFRGNPPVNRDEIARMLVALGTIGLAYPRIQEIDINPLIVDAAGAVAVDATIIVM